ncbi:MAG: hypothetical protein ACUVWV_07490 [Thermodesulfobacteriota bacterium]
MREYLLRISLGGLIFFLMCACASLEKISEKILSPDTFSCTYDLNFYSFHPKFNSFLQEYARQHKGSSFQIRRLGSAEVIWRGILKLKNRAENLPVEIVSKPAGQKKSKLEIKFLDDSSLRTSASGVRASAEFFQAVEEGMKINAAKD